LYRLSDKQVEYQILDRLSFKQFLGLESGDKVPDEKTIWLFRENITNKGLVEQVFNLFHKYLEKRTRHVLGLFSCLYPVVKPPISCCWD
jgi:IS5 family transposase